MAFLGGLFGKKPGKKARRPQGGAGGQDARAADASKVMADLRRHQQMLEKRLDHLNKRYDALTQEASQLARTKKRSAALAKLKQRKLIGKQQESTQGKITNMELQILTLEEAVMNDMTMRAYEEARGALTALVTEEQLEEAAQVQDELAEAMELQEELSALLNQPLVQFDEAELDAELAALDEEIPEDDLLLRQANLYVQPPPQEVVRPVEVHEPEVAPAVEARKEEEEELRRLEMDFAMASRDTRQPVLAVG